MSIWKQTSAALAVAGAILVCAGQAAAQCPPQSQSGQPTQPVDVNGPTNTNITYSWSASTAVASPSGYVVFVAPAGSGNRTQVCTTTANVRSCTGPSLAVGQYDWFVRTNYANCTGGVDSPIKQFTIGCLSAAPTVGLPTDGSTNVPTNVTLKWSNVGADSYDIYIGPAGVGCALGAPSGTTQAGVTSFTPPQLQPATTYEWKVVAKKASCPSSLMTCARFQTAAACPTGVAAITAPANASTFSPTDKITFSWTQVTGATGYDLLTSTDNGQTLNVVGSTSGETATTLTRSFTTTGNYAFAIRAKFANNCTPTVSSARTFTIAASCSGNAPAVTAPASGSSFDVGKTVTFSWTNVGGETGYDLLVSTDNGQTFTVKGSVGADVTSASTSFSAAGSYLFFIRANYPAPCPSVASAVSRLNIVAAANCPTASATPLSPANGATVLTNMVKFSWTGVANAAKYRLMVSTNGATPTAVALTDDTELVASIQTGTTEWYVDTFFEQLTCPAVSSTHFRFTIPSNVCPTNPGSPSIASPADGAANVGSPVTFQWTAVSGATSYRVFASINGAAPVSLGTTTSTSLTVSVPSGSVLWYVEAQFGTTCPGTFSPRASFTVTAGGQCSTNAATLLQPANGAANVETPTDFKWSDVAGAAGYLLYLSVNGGDFGIVAATDDHEATRLLPTGASVSWYVETRFAGCPNTKSNTFRFTTLSTNCPTGSITPTAPINGATVSSPVAFTWTGFAGAVAYRLWVSIDGSEPTTIARTTGTTATVSLPSGVADWYVEAILPDTCPPILSPHARFTISRAANCDTHTPATLVSPVGTAASPATATSPVDFRWNASGAAAYRVWVAPVGGAPADIGTTKDDHLSHDIPAGSYSWFVEAFYDGCPPVSSTRAFFKVDATAARCANETPTLIAPAANASVPSVATFLWSSVPNAVEYRLFASLDGGDEELVGVTPETSFTHSVPPGSVVWFVQAVFRGCPATTSARSRFTVPKAQNCRSDAPQPISPPDGATDVDPDVDFSWAPVSGAINYIVFLKLGEGAYQPLGETADNHLTRNLGDGRYRWRVVALFNGCSPTVSPERSFTIPAADACDHRRPVLLTPVDGARDLLSPIHFSWTAVARAKAYQLWGSEGRDEPSLLATTTKTEAAVGVPPGIVHWFVRAVFEGCPSVSSAVGDFVVLRTPPACRTPDKPLATVIGQALANTRYSVRWTPLANVSLYELQEATLADFSNATTQTTTDVKAAFEHADPDKPVQYFYRVRGISSCNDERGPYSDVVSIFIIPQKPTATQQSTSAEVGVEGDVVQTLFLDGVTPPGLAGTTFNATVDKPWLTVTPSSGTVPAGGITLQIVADPSTLPTGTNTGTVRITYGATVTAAARTASFSPRRGEKVPKADEGFVIGPSGVSVKSTPVSVTLVTPVAPGGKNTPPPDSLIIPAVAHAAGVNDSLFETDVRVTNLSAQTRKYLLNFTPSGVDGTQTSSSTTIQIDPGATTALDDILANFFGSGSAGASATGMLEVRPLASSSSTSAFGTPSLGVTKTTVASSRTYNFTPNGTFGQFIPAIPFAQFIGKTSPPSVLTLQQIAQSSAYRTNFGLVEASGEPADVILRVYNNAGTQLGEIPVSLLAGEHKPLNSLLAANNIALDDGRIEVEVTSSTGKVTAYASEIDNRTNDPLLVSPVLKGSVSTNRFALPGVADLNNGIASWRTDLRIFNSGTSPADATLTYYPQGNPGAPLSATITLAAGEVRAVDNALQTLYNLTNSGGQIIVTTEANAPLVVTARTYNQTTTGTYGQFIPGVTPAESIAAGDAALQVLQVEQSDRIRTNIGLAETTGKPATVEVSLVLPDSKVTPKVSIPLAPNEFRQISVADFGAGTVYNGRVTVSVIDGDGKVTAYGSAVDQITQDPTYVRAQ